ncbi:response regulator [uncultured Aliiroseovarius sp.]|uniref:response regulator n=1 Tax=uncultured Aliiroseovarius sp. TaxID=1658783 RepID=UPI00259250B9|nr:response regulator [uncultured Aliiroseovarius sp.]
MRILAVDDDDYVLELLEAVLKSGGFNEYTLVNNAAAALREIAQASPPFDCILLDIQMPEMDGIELCGLIRALPKYRSCPVLMLTAMTDRSYIDRAFSAGATDYVSKPFDPLELSTRIRLAGKLVNEQKIATGSALELQSLKRKVDVAFSFSIDDPVTIDDVPGAIDRLVMENYLLQLSRGKIFQSMAVGIAIQNFADLWERSSLSEIYLLLVDVADAIALNFQGENYLLSYCGRGRFVCITPRNIADIFEDMSQRIQASVVEFDLAEDDDIWIVLGKPIAMSFWDSGNPLQLIDEAILSVDSVCHEHVSSSTKSNWWSKFHGLFGTE